MRAHGMLAVLALVGLSLIFVAPGAANAKLDGTSWVLATLHGQPPLTAPSGRPLTLNFKDGEVGGLTGCNSCFGLYTEGPGRKIHIERLITTLIMCYPQEIMDQEGLYRTALKEAAQYNLAGGKLRLKDAAGKVSAVFTPQSYELKGTAWKVKSYNNGTSVVSLIAGTKLDAIFGTNGKINGSAGCNTYFGPYTSSVSGKTLSIGELATTRKLCHKPAGVMLQEEGFIAALKTAASYQIAGVNLTLKKADGSVAVNLVKK